jgi:hypothetical protein
MTPIVDRVASSWNAFWFTPAPALNLAAARVIFALHALWILASRDLAATSELPDAFWAGVPIGDRWRFLLLPELAAADRALQWLAAAALVAAIVGLWPRLACLLAGLLLYHLAPLETIYWTANPYERGFTVAVPALLVLGAARSGDRLTIVPRAAASPVPSADYRWPLVLVQLFLLQVYFISGYAKVYRAGLEWVDGDNLRRWLLVFGEFDQVSTVSWLTVWVANQPVLCWGVSALLLDLGLITILIWPRLRGWLIALALSFHAGIVVLMGIAFLNIPQWLIFADWDRLAARLALRRADASPRSLAESRSRLAT